MKIDKSSIAHTAWNCKYHIVFAPKYRRQVIYGKIKVDIGQIIRKLCEWKGVEIIEAEACPDHIHLLVSIPPKIAVAKSPLAVGRLFDGLSVPPVTAAYSRRANYRLSR